MKFTIPRDRLIEGLNSIGNVISQRSPLPILSNVLIAAGDGQVTLVATDLDITARITLPAAVAEPGAFTLPAKRLLLVVRDVVPGDVVLSSDQKTAARLDAGKAVFKLNGLPEPEFPKQVHVGEAVAVELDQAVLRAAMENTIFAVSDDDARYVLKGINFEFEGKAATLVGTDGKRMAVVEADTLTPISAPRTFILPTKACIEVLRMLDQGSVTIRIGTGGASFETAARVLHSKFIEGKFPQFRQVIPTNCTLACEVDRARFIAAASRVAILENREGSIGLRTGRGSVCFHSAAGETDAAEEKIDAIYSGPDLDLSINPGYILDPLRNIKADRVTLYFAAEPSAPMMLKSPFTYVLMPCRSS